MPVRTISQLDYEDPFCAASIRFSGKRSVQMSGHMRKYDRIVRLIRQRIETGSLKVGERLPSVRRLREMTGYSISTIQHAYGLLEGDGLIEARPRSGFIVSRQISMLLDFDADDDESGSPTDEPVTVSDLALAVAPSWRRKGMEYFGAIHPSQDLFPRDKLDAALRKTLRRGAMDASELNSPEGDPMLREAIARHALNKGILARPKDVIVVGTGLQGLDLCLEAVTQPGDIVLVETPSGFPIFAALERRGLLAVEIYSHPKNGVNPEQLEFILKNNNIKACIFMPVCHYPTGITYGKPVMQAIAATTAKAGVPVIELDMFSDLNWYRQLIGFCRKGAPHPLVKRPSAHR